MSSRRMFVVAIGVLALFACLLSTGAGSQVILGFSESYTAGGEGRVHSGIDLAASADSAVSALCGGRVAFVGRVPASDGGTMLVVSLDTAAGRLSLMPLSVAQVTQGESVEAGALLGRLASSGDASSDVTHLHVGLRREGLYVDPSALLAPVPSPASIPADSPAARAATGSNAAAPAVAVPNSSMAVEPHQAPSAQPAAVGSAMVQSSPAAQPANEAVPLTGAQAESSMGSGVSLAPTELGVGGTDAAQTAVGVGPRTGRVGSAMRVPAFKLEGRPLVLQRGHALAGSLAALAAVAAGTIVVLTRRWTARQAIQPKVSTRFGTLLQHLRAGDTLCGLTSCSGPTAFTVPGPSAQRR